MIQLEPHTHTHIYIYTHTHMIQLGREFQHYLAMITVLV